MAGKIVQYHPQYARQARREWLQMQLVCVVCLLRRWIMLIRLLPYNLTASKHVSTIDGLLIWKVDFLYGALRMYISWKNERSAIM